MTRRRRPSRFRERAAAVAVVALALAAGVTAHPRAAAAQACCVGTGLVTPARLRTFEDHAVGVQMRARSVMGAFGESGSYATSAAGNRDVGFEEDLFGALRLGSHFQVALMAPFIQTSRAAAGTSGFGGGLGDLAASARCDAVNAGERGYWPGVAVLAGLALPTGRPPDEADDPLATSGTGTGFFEGSLGVSVEEIVGQRIRFAGGLVSQRSPAPSSAWSRRSRRGCRRCWPAATRSGTTPPSARSRRCCDKATRATRAAPSRTAASRWSPPEPRWRCRSGTSWRLQTTLFADVPIAGWGRNQTVGFGGTLAIIRFWI